MIYKLPRMTWKPRSRTLKQGWLIPGPLNQYARALISKAVGGLDQKARVTLTAQFSIVLSIIVMICHDYHHHCYSFRDLRVYIEIAYMRFDTSNQNSSAWECSLSQL